MGEYQLRAIRELSKCFYAETKIPNRDALPTPLDLLMKKRTKLPRVDPDEEYKNMDQKLPSKIQKNPPSAATREKYTKN